MRAQYTATKQSAVRTQDRSADLLQDPWNRPITERFRNDHQQLLPDFFRIPFEHMVTQPEGCEAYGPPAASLREPGDLERHLSPIGILPPSSLDGTEIRFKMARQTHGPTESEIMRPPGSYRSLLAARHRRGTGGWSASATSIAIDLAERNLTEPAIPDLQAMVAATQMP